MATVTHAHPHHSIGSTDLGRRVWAIVGGSSGNLVGWYDLYVYSFPALSFAPQSFPLIGGQLLAVLVLVILQQYLSPAELKAWGWRIPFAIGAVAAVVAFFLRRSLAETTSADVRNKLDAGTLKGVFRYPRSFITVLGFTAGGSLVFYTFTTYMQKYLVNTAGMTAKTASAVMTLVLLCFMLLQPLFGAISDKIGRRNSMICFGVFMVLATIPISSALADVANSYAACRP